MTNRYVYSGATFVTGLTWADAYQTLAAALTAAAAGDDIFVAHDHSESTASAITLTSPGTLAAPCRIICVNRTGSVPPVAADLATTGVVTTTGASNITCTGFAYCYGIIFNAGSGAVSANFIVGVSAAQRWIFDACHLNIVATGSSNSFGFGSSSGLVGSDTELRNTVLKFGAISHAISAASGKFLWRGGSIDASGSAPTNLFNAIGNNRQSYPVLVEGVDLSHMGSGKNLLPAGLPPQLFVFKDCKLNASVTKAVPTGVGGRVELIQCDSGDTNYTRDAIDVYGTQSVETTIVRTGGASDGTTPIAQKFVTSSDAKQITPFRSVPIVFWNETSGSPITITLQGIWGGGAVPNNDDIWVEAEYFGDASFPLGAYASDGKATVLSTNAAQTPGSGTWGGSTTKFSLDVTITPLGKGPIYLTVCVGAASSTFYIDPKPVIT